MYGNITSESFFQNEVPVAFQMPIAAKFLAMSQTVDVIIIAHGKLLQQSDLLQRYQDTALSTNAYMDCSGVLHYLSLQYSQRMPTQARDPFKGI